MQGIRRLLVLAAVAVAAFAFALFSFDEGAEAGCALEATTDLAYAVALETAPSTQASTYRLSLTRDGVAVTGAQVCLRAEMTGMSAMGVSDDAVEVEPGVYEVAVRFEMAGPWNGTALVQAGGAESVAVPLAFDVTG